METLSNPSVLVLLLLFIIIFGSPAVASESPQNGDSWPAFRGSDSSGSTVESVLTSDDSPINVLWSVSLPGSGHSSPVVHEKKVFLSTSYLNQEARLIVSIMVWGAVATIVVAAALALTLGSLRIFSERETFVFGVHIWGLFFLVVLGYHLLGCSSDTVRTGIYAALVVTVALNTSSVSVGLSRYLQVAVCCCALLVTTAFLAYFLTLPFLRQRYIVLSLCLLPMFCAVMTVRTQLYGSRCFCLIRWTVATLIVVLPVLAIGYTTWRDENTPFFVIQPLKTLTVPPVYSVAFGALLATGLVLRLAPRVSNRGRVTGLSLLALSAVLAVPLCAAPLVNSLDYLRYQFIRGSLDSALGLPAALMITIAIALLPLVTPSEASRVSHRIRKNPGILRFVLFTLPLMAGLAGGLSAITQNHAGTICALLALDVRSGQMLWQTDGLAGGAMPMGNSYNSLATPSPVVVGDLVVAYFGERGVFACQREIGTRVWSYLDLPYSSEYGAGSSLGASDSIVVVQSDCKGAPSFVTGLSIANGRPAWRFVRDCGPSWRTPIVFRWQGRAVVCAWGNRECDFLDAESGKHLVRLRGIKTSIGDPVVSPIVKLRSVYFAGTERLIIVAIDPLIGLGCPEIQLNLGDRTPQAGSESLIIIEPESCIDLGGEGPTCSTGALDGQFLFQVSDDGILCCISLERRSVIWKTEVGPTLSSPVIADRHLYLVSEAGMVHVFILGDVEPELVTTLDLGEAAVASPAVASGRLFIRTKTKLYCLGEVSP